MMQWKLKTGHCHEAFQKFLSTGAPIPGCTFQRFHAPGSYTGWIIVESEDVIPCYVHAAEWSEIIDWNVTPVLPDAKAGEVAASVFPQFLPKTESE